MRAGNKKAGFCSTFCSSVEHARGTLSGLFNLDKIDSMVVPPLERCHCAAPKAWSAHLSSSYFPEQK